MDRWYNITSKTDGSKKMEPKKSPIFISFRFQNPNLRQLLPSQVSLSH